MIPKFILAEKDNKFVSKGSRPLKVPTFEALYLIYLQQIGTVHNKADVAETFMGCFVMEGMEMESRGGQFWVPMECTIRLYIRSVWPCFRKERTVGKLIQHLNTSLQNCSRK